jgi:stage V sporulation protein G
MEITEVKVFPIQEEKLKAFVSIFISMPSRKKKNGEFKDVAHPLNNETRRMIEEQVLGEYHRVLAERGEEPMALPSASSMSSSAALGEEREERVPMAAAPPPSEKSMEEVQEMHLRDSFWTVP